MGVAQKRNERVWGSLTLDVLRRLEAIAIAEDRTLSAVVSRFVEEGIARYELARIEAARRSSPAA